MVRELCFMTRPSIAQTLVSEYALAGPCHAPPAGERMARGPIPSGGLVSDPVVRSAAGPEGSGDRSRAAAAGRAGSTSGPAPARAARFPPQRAGASAGFRCIDRLARCPPGAAGTGRVIDSPPDRCRVGPTRRPAPRASTSLSRTGASAGPAAPTAGASPARERAASFGCLSP